MSELKPCPLCGQDCEEAKAVHEQFGEVDIVRCTICGYRVYPDNMHGQWWTAVQSHRMKPYHTAKEAPDA